MCTYYISRPVCVMRSSIAVEPANWHTTCCLSARQTAGDPKQLFKETTRGDPESRPCGCPGQVNQAALGVVTIIIPGFFVTTPWAIRGRVQDLPGATPRALQLNLGSRSGEQLVSERSAGPKDTGCPCQWVLNQAALGIKLVNNKGPIYYS